MKSRLIDVWSERRSGVEKRRKKDIRTPSDRDRARLIHSAGFRRLQGKTQVLGIGEGDFHRTRLTHTMEVAQVARGIVKQLQSGKSKIKDCLPSLELIESVAFAHDLGHPPFGHGGEIALNYMMRDVGGFEGNGHSLRLIAKLEAGMDVGLDLTRRTVLGILKYPRPYSDVVRVTPPPLPRSFVHVGPKDWKPPKCYFDSEGDIVSWVLDPFSTSDREHFTALKASPTDSSHGRTKQKSLDCAVMELADDIAYGVHDFEDGVALGLIPGELADRLRDEIDPTWAKQAGLAPVDRLLTNLFTPSAQGGNRKLAIGALVHAMIISVMPRLDERFEHPLLGWSVDMDHAARTFLSLLNDIKFKYMIEPAEVQTLEYRGRLLVMELFDGLSADPERLLQGASLRRYRMAMSESERMRSICDYVAGMTDEYATRMFERLFVPREGSIFVPL